jgi:hypothetical protein
MTEIWMLDYIEHVIAPNCPKHSFLFMDKLSSHLTKAVQLRLRELFIIPCLFPAKTAPDLSPCDNFFFHLYKQAFRRKDRSTAEKKKAAAFAAYDGITSQKVLACWRKCKLLLQQPQPQKEEEEERSDYSDEELLSTSYLDI